VKYKIIRFLQIAFPLLVTIALWRLSCAWINPAGVLCVIPIFYCSFIRPTPWFSAFALIMCFLLDYKMGTGFLWTVYYCLVYAIMNLQTVVDLSHTNRHGLFAFMAFIGPIFLFMIMQDINWANLLYGLVTFGIATIMYIPTITTIRVVQK